MTTPPPTGERLRRVVLRLQRSLVLALTIAVGRILPAAEPAPEPPPLDPLAAAVVDSLASTPRNTAAELLEAVNRAAAVEAPDVALGYFRRLVGVIAEAGEGGPDLLADLLADLGDAADPAELARTERLLGRREPDLPKLFAEIRNASRLRRRDPKRLEGFAEALDDDAFAVRSAAADELARAGLDAVGVLARRLTPPPPPEDTADARARTIVRGLIERLGEAAVEPLVAWLGSGDTDNWPGVMRSLAVCGSAKDADFLLGPLLVVDSSEEIRAAAAEAYRTLVPTEGGRLPNRSEAIVRLSRRLDALLRPAGLLPGVGRAGHGRPDATREDPLLWEFLPEEMLVAARDDQEEGFLFDPDSGVPRRAMLSRRFNRGLLAGHLARDLVALEAADPESVRLVLLAQLEGAVVAPGSLARRGSAAVFREAATGPDGFRLDLAAELLDAALERGMTHAAAAAVQAISGPLADSRPIPAVQKALVRGLDSNDRQLQFMAATALAASRAEGFAGSSRLIATLASCSEAAGVDRVVVAHPVAARATSLAARLAAGGFKPVTVSSGHAAVTAAGHPDVCLVVLAARLADPDPLETVAVIRRVPSDGPPPVLVVVDPIDDAEPAEFRRRLRARLEGFQGERLERVAVIDSLRGFFEPADGPEGATPRLPAVLSRLGAEGLLVGARRRRLAEARAARARRALATLAGVADRGFGMTPAIAPASRALAAGRHTAEAAGLLAAIPAGEAQLALVEAAAAAGGDPAGCRVAADALTTSIEAFGLLIGDAEVAGLVRRYTGNTSEVCRSVMHRLGEASLSVTPADSSP